MTAARCVTWAEAVRRSAEWRASGARVVLAEGAFDLLSAGHVRFLADARSRGQRLIVLVLGDRSAASLGRGRPVLSAEERARLVAGLRGVDLVVTVERDEADALAAELGAADRFVAPEAAENAGVARVVAAQRAGA
jgi:cytidyltransferase-like protein